MVHFVFLHLEELPGCPHLPLQQPQEVGAEEAASGMHLQLLQARKSSRSWYCGKDPLLWSVHTAHTSQKMSKVQLSLMDSFVQLPLSKTKDIA